MYCTQDDLIAAYGERDIVQLSDRVNKPPVAIDVSVVTKAIEDAEGEIDLHLAARYQLPLVDVPPTLTRIACVLAYRNLYTQIAETHPAEVAAARQRVNLLNLAKGVLSLANTAAGTPTPVNDTVQISEGRNDWGERW